MVEKFSWLQINGLKTCMESSQCADVKYAFFLGDNVYHQGVAIDLNLGTPFSE